MSGYGGRLDGFNDDFDFAEAPPQPAPELEPPVSYTHLTLPTILLV